MSNFSLEIAAPAPLSPLTDVVISPANIAAQQRQKQARRLRWGERRKIRKQIARLDKQLKKSGYKEIRAVYVALRPKVAQLHASYTELRMRVQENPDDPELQSQMALLLEQLKPIKEQWDTVKLKAHQISPILQQHQKLCHLLKDHSIAVAREKAESRLRKAMEKEAAIYEQIIIDKWTALGFCHRYTEKNKQKTHKVSFSQISITLDAIYFKINASFKTAFGNWKTEIPQTVRVKEDLLDPSTLDELSIACQRQVTAVWSPDGAWVIVHRLDSVDGLLNYVKFDDVMERYPAQHAHRMPICVGVGANRQVQWVNLAQYPHWLIGGFTNSGKSNMVNVGICTLITKHHPRDLRLVLIDLKGGLEFSYYRDIPHLHGEIVDSIEGVANALSEMESLMKERFKQFRGIAKTLSEYHIRRPNEHMPRVLVVFDEVASIIGHGDLTKQIIASLRELTRMGRAVGIHIWLCTQRPDTQAIDGSIKANLAVRISGRMTTSADSVTILGTGAAKDLAAIPGRMVMQLGPDPIQIQSPYIDQDDIENSLKRAKLYSAPPSLEIPESSKIVHQVWTVERVIELSLRHLGGKITWKDVYQAADDLSQSQARKLVESVWNMGEVEFEGKKYRVQKGRSNLRTLVQIEQNVA